MEVLNATTFIDGSYLAKFLSGDKTDTERIRHDEALEKYQDKYQDYQNIWRGKGLSNNRKRIRHKEMRILDKILQIPTKP